LRTEAILFLTATLAFAFASFAFLRLNRVSSLRNVVSGDLFAMIDKWVLIDESKVPNNIWQKQEKPNKIRFSVILCEISVFTEVFLW